MLFRSGPRPTLPHYEEWVPAENPLAQGPDFFPNPAAHRVLFLEAFGSPMGSSPRTPNVRNRQQRSNETCQPIVGVGYVGSIQGDSIALRVGFANEIKHKIPVGLDVTCPDQNHIIVKGCDKQQVGQFAAEVRAVRKPEPYKGKGIRYDGEYVKIKPGKSAT